METIRFFGEQDTRDELGIGTIRDAFSEFFFPGTSTIQTRIHYMLFIPWILKKLEEEGTSSAEFEQKAKNRQISLMKALKKGEDQEGLIGREAGEALKRLPTSIYWTGLWSWGIRKFQGSLSDYYRSMDFYHKKKKTITYTDDGDPAEEGHQGNWDPNLPKAPNSFPWEAEFKLSTNQSAYLQDCIKLNHPDSLFFYLLEEGELFYTDYFWEEPKVQRIEGDLKKDINHARFFSQTSLGASLLYNLLLAKKSNNSEKINKYEETIEQWSGKMKSNAYELNDWNSKRNYFWNSNPLSLTRIPHKTIRFVDAWLDIVFSKKLPIEVMNCTKAIELIEKREWELKKTRARLFNNRALQSWGGASGTRQLTFRWANVKQFIYDLQKDFEEG